MKLFLGLCLLAILLVFGNHLRKSINPFPEVEWRENTPGATSRYITYTPVLKSNKEIVLGPELGADYAELYFEDLNQDGQKEALIETKPRWHLEMCHYEKHILYYHPDKNGLPHFELSP